MNKVLPVLLLSVVLFSCGVQQQTPEILSGRILILGDSITQDGRYVSILEYELFKHYPDADIDIISIGLSSETASGLTEPDHPYPRPNVHERLGRALEKAKPQTVFACYGMNDGIYFPQSDERFQAYKDGMLKLIADVKAIGADVIILTPPIFDAAVIPQKVVGVDAAQFGYAHPYAGYNDVLHDYAEWLLSLDIQDVHVIDLNGPMLDYTLKKRVDDPNFALSVDGVHPQLAGHALMAQQALKGIGVPMPKQDPVDYAEALQNDGLYTRVHDRRAMRSMAWLVDIGFDKPGDYKGLPVEQAEEKAQAEKAEIVAIIKGER